MYRRLSLRSLCLLFAIALPASAQFTRDTAANKKIDEAINEHYLSTDFEKAEGVLTGTVTACADKCSPQVLAKAWMYVGVVRGSGKSDLAGAKEAFQKALAADPTIKLDSAISTPETQKVFADLGGQGGGAPDSPPTPPPPAATGGEDAVAPGGLTCTPDVRELQTRQPIPIECTSAQDEAGMEVRYKSVGADWVTLKMTKKGATYRAEIPCDATKSSGEFKLYARAKDAGGETISNWGSKKEPIAIKVGEVVKVAPPSFPGEPAPARCEDASECPPDFPGCGDAKKRGNVDWGGPCENSTQCKSGLLCESGVCETAPSCDNNADCSTGSCVAGKCDVGNDDGSSGGPYQKNWLGLHFGLDIAVVGGSEVCAGDGDYDCYPTGNSDTPYAGPPYPGAGIATGTALATQRLLVSYDRAFSANVMAGLRLGYAFNGGPPTVDSSRKKFLPVHAEARLSYWFGRNALGKKGLRPYVFAGGGMAQVDAKVSVTVYDCNGQADVGNCSRGVNTARASLPKLKLDAWKKLGQGFAAVGGGVVFAFKDNLGAQLNVNAMYMLGASGVVFEPSLGLVYGL